VAEKGHNTESAAGDALLGERWREAGALAGFEAAIEQGPGLFLAAVAAVVVAAAAAFAGLWYLTAPRLAEFAGALPVVVLAVGGVFFLYIVLEYGALVATVYSGKNILLPLARWRRGVVRLAPAAAWLARFFGTSRDRMVHSFVEVSNAATRAGRRRRERRRGPIAVLFPRCLQRPGCRQPLAESIDNCQRCGKCVIVELLELRAEYNGVVMAVLSGGSVVPGVVRRLEPRAVIGVACERELYDGIAVVEDRPVLGVANQRPEGPCRATVVVIDELRAALETFAPKA